MFLTDWFSTGTEMLLSDAREAEEVFASGPGEGVCAMPSITRHKPAMRTRMRVFLFISYVGYRYDIIFRFVFAQPVTACHLPGFSMQRDSLCNLPYPFHERISVIPLFKEDEVCSSFISRRTLPGIF